MMKAGIKTNRMPQVGQGSASSTLALSAGIARAGRLARRQAAQGFTLIEILIVIVILGVLGSVLVPNLISRPDQARVQAAQTDLRTLSSALDVYRLDNFTYPSSEQGLEALIEKPVGFPEAKNWNAEGYLKKQPVDPWGTPYIYENVEGTVSLYSLGADASEGGEGFNADITLSEL